MSFVDASGLQQLRGRVSLPEDPDGVDTRTDPKTYTPPCPPWCWCILAGTVSALAYSGPIKIAKRGTVLVIAGPGWDNCYNAQGRKICGTGHPLLFPRGSLPLRITNQGLVMQRRDIASQSQKKSLATSNRQFGQLYVTVLIAIFGIRFYTFQML